MQRNMVVYNNETKTAERMEVPCASENIGISVAESWEKLITELDAGRAQLVLLDIVLDDKGWGSSMRLIAEIRAHSRMPIIVVSRQASETAKIMALNSGADDFVSADCNPLELLARIKSQLRRYTQSVNTRVNPGIGRIYRVDGLEMDDAQRRVSVDGREVKLTPIEYKILRLLVREKGRALSVSQIYESIWNMKAIGADNTIAVHIRHIREKIESNPKEPQYLRVVWGTGYKVG